MKKTMKVMIVGLILGLMVVALSFGNDLRGIDYNEYKSWSPDHQVRFLQGMMMGSVLMQDMAIIQGDERALEFNRKYSVGYVELHQIHSYIVGFYVQHSWDVPLFQVWLQMLFDMNQETY